MTPEAQQPRRRSRLGRRLSSLVLGAALVALIGDRAHTAGIGGIDPLEILNLAVKPNVIIVLDSSGSMRSDPAGGTNFPLLGGDWAGSKMFQAKQVLKQVIAANESKVSFLFGQYTQQDSVFDNESPGQTRFFYTTTDTSMATAPELTLRRTSSLDTTTRGHQAWQDIRPAWNTLYFGEATTVVVNPPSIVISATNAKFIWRERISTSPYRYNTCTVTLPASLYATYSTDVEINNFFAQLNTLTAAGETAIPNRTCVRTGGGVAPFGPSQPLTFTWLGSPSFQVRIDKGAFVAPATSALRIQLVRGTGADETILNDLGFANSIPNSAITPTNALTTSDWTSAVSFTGTAIGGTTTAVVITCAIPIASQFYQTGPALAAALQAAMNTNDASCPRGAGANTYGVTFNNATGVFTFGLSTGTNQFQMRWGDTPNNIAGALGSYSTPNTGLSTSSKVTASSIRLLNRTTAQAFTSGGVRTYYLQASRFFNGETYSVLNDTTGTLCGVSSTVTPTNPPTVSLQRVSSCGGGAVGAPVVFTYSGGQFSGNSISCQGFNTKVNLVACNFTGSQSATINPLLDLEIPLTATGLNLQGYAERQDGSWNTQTLPPTGPGIVADGATPIAGSIDDVRTLFNTLWTAGQNPGPPILTAISSHTAPKERTIVMFVTDGDDTCAGQASGDANARAAAYSGQLLYDPIVGGVQSPTGFLTAGADPASSVTTYVVGFGAGASTNRLNWIAWGGSGMTRPVCSGAWCTSPTAADRANCVTCQDAFLAPDAATLTAALQAILDQGATSGSFTAQQSIVASVFEMVAEVSGFSPNSPTPPSRYDAIVPIQFQASFDLPAFQGKLKAIQFDTATATPFTKWEAGQLLLTRVQNGPTGSDGMNQIGPLEPGAAAGQGTFSQLHGSATDATVRTSSAAIKRRIYTTTQNGSFALGGGTPILNADLSNLRAGLSPNRTTLWPPTTTGAAVAPASNTTQGVLDVALGLPTDAQITAGAAAQFAALQTNFKACLGVTLPVSCTTAGTTQALRARREAREMILAYTAGAEVVPDVAANPARVTGGTAVGEILYKARNWVLAESTLAPPAVVSVPLSGAAEVLPSNFRTEYGFYTDGVQVGAVAQNGLSQGIGLANPDKDFLTPSSPPTPVIDTRTTLKPAMTVAYLGANDMLHAFRAGPTCGTPGGSGLTATYSTCTEKGGEELWGFVPFDRLGVLKNLLKPQTRQNKTYVIGAPLRFGDVFVDAPGGSMTFSVGSATITARGMWRQFLVFGRGPGGKYVTALDITGRGAYTTRSLDSQAPIVLWSRGNPDTVDGTTGGAIVNDTADRNAYDKMGETWSVPAIAFVDRTTNVTARRPYDAVSGLGGVPMVAYMGSGYCSPCNPGEGTTFYTLDVTTGDVVAAVNVETEAAAAGVQRSGLAYANALVASPAAYSAKSFDPLQPGHPAEPTTRVYVGDLHGRLWKFLSSAPSQALLLADLGADQPVGTAAALLGLSAATGAPAKPYVFVTSGNDSRATGTFKIFGFKDDGDDTTATYGSATATTDPGVRVYSPAVYQFSRAFDLPNFRGTIQPATALTIGGNGRVFFGATRFNLPGSPEAPPPFPCRSSFDSLIFALGAQTGGAAYDLNSSGDDAYLLFTNSRKTAIQVIKQPTPPSAPPGTRGKGMLMIDEGLMASGSVQPPPAPGLQPQIPAPPNVGMVTTDSAGRTFPQLTTPYLCQTP